MTLARREGVIFVGGTPFSGAEVVADLIGTHPEVATLPVPARFHSDPWGIPAMLGGRIGLEDFVARLRTQEVVRLLDPDRLDAAIASFRDGYHSDPLDSCRGLFWALVSQSLDPGDARLVVESSPGNLAEAHTLARLVPEARFVHVVRDGRDVAAAVCEADSGTRRMQTALEVWADWLRENERGFRGEEDGAPYAIPEERFATVVLDELASDERQAAYRGLLARLSLGGDESTSTPDAPPLDPAAVGVGRWRRHARGPGGWLLSRRYVRTLGELEAEGNHAAPPLMAAYEWLA